jgi:hypothetical protein
MADFTYSVRDFREIHDWDLRARSIIDAIELLVLVPVTMFGFYYALSGKLKSAKTKHRSIAIVLYASSFASR